MTTLTIFQQLARRWSVMNYVHISLLDDAIRAGLARPDEEKIADSTYQNQVVRAL